MKVLFKSEIAPKAPATLPTYIRLAEWRFDQNNGPVEWVTHMVIIHEDGTEGPEYGHYKNDFGKAQADYMQRCQELGVGYGNYECPPVDCK